MGDSHKYAQGLYWDLFLDALCAIPVVVLAVALVLFLI